MKRKKSFIREIVFYLAALTVLLLAALGVFLGCSYEILENEIKDSSKDFTEIYRNEFDRSISEMNQILKSITIQSEDLAKISGSDENARSLASISLHNVMLEAMGGDVPADLLVICDDNYKVCLDAMHRKVDITTREVLREFTGKAVRNEQVTSFEWNFVELDGTIYLYKMLLNGSRAIAIYTRAQQLLEVLTSDVSNNRSLLLVDNDGLIGNVWGHETEDIKIGGHLSDINEGNYYIDRKEVVEGQLAIICYSSKTNIFHQVYTSMIVVAVVAGSAVLFMVFILLYTRREIVIPMNLMVEDMEHIRGGEYEKRVSGKFHTREFLTLRDTINQMVEEIVGLKIQTYEKKIELQNMELKSIRLQLKPHFFLNALTTISSLSSQSKNEQIKRYIDALSKNVRYMFRAGFHTVPIREEMRHVENYFEMQDLKYPDSIFYLIELPKELEEWKIPQMLIHTFIENEYKYAVSMEQTLTILIKVSSVVRDTEEMILIEIEDDGGGYPVEVLDYMNGYTEKISGKGSRIGLWSIKRMMEMMYDKEDLVILSNIEPHGCLNQIYVPQNSAHELPEETIQTKL